MRWLSASAALLALGISVSAASSLVMISTEVSAQGTQGAFPDVQPDYWAQPFIQELAEAEIVTGYLDGTYRPERPLERDEFAAIIRQAFSQERVRTIPSGSVFKDVPDGYWAAPPIEEAYEAGFMRDFQGNLFRPREEVSRIEALVALARGLNLTYDPTPSVAAQATTTPVTIQPANERQATRQRKPLIFPLAATTLMQPLYSPPVRTQAPPADTTPPTVAAGQNVPSGRSASELVQAYYEDADQIPEDAIDDVAALTQANIVVNYPDVRVLNPNEPLKRGSAAALIYQALVRQGKMPPLDVEASRYVVRPTSEGNQTAQADQ